MQTRFFLTCVCDGGQFTITTTQDVPFRLMPKEEVVIDDGTDWIANVEISRYNLPELELEVWFEDANFPSEEEQDQAVEALYALGWKNL